MPNSGEALVLVATTDKPFAAALKGALEAMSCQVIVVGGVIDAIAELHGLEFDLAFVSHALPPRSGADVVRVAKQLSPDTEVVVVLDEGREDAPVEHVRLGAFDFLHRPLRDGELGAVVQRALERRRERTSNAMYRASHAILGGTKPDDLPRVIVELMASVLDADGAAYFRMTGEQGIPVVGEQTGFKETPVADLANVIEHLDIDGPAPILLPDDRDPALFRATRIRTAIAVPIVIEGHIAGVLAAHRSVDPRPYRRGDAERMAVFASQLRLALENSRLIEKTVATERLAAVGELAAGVAHEIASPLTYVLGNAISATEEIGRPNPDHDELKAMLGDIKDGAERIRDIARDLRTLSRGSSMKETFDLGDTVRGALRIVGSTVRGALKVETHFDPTLLVCGSPGRLSQVFINLIVNAAHAAKSTGKMVKLEITCTKVNEKLVAVVRDEGPGINPKNLARIFDAFFTTKTAETGTGLGLSITRSIVEAHGGTIDVASEVGRGTAFTIQLPAGQLIAESLGSAA
jgi:signal transduction histidine kinase/ActR/RegA family two-component response regulator